jgi:hypothetical protein
VNADDICDTASAAKPPEPITEGEPTSEVRPDESSTELGDDPSEEGGCSKDDGRAPYMPFCKVEKSGILPGAGARSGWAGAIGGG